MARLAIRSATKQKIKELLKKEYKALDSTAMTFYRPTSKPAVRKGLVLSDIHIPFHPKDLLREIVNEHSDADVLFVNGDILDCYNISNFIKEKYIPLLFEYHEAIKWIDDMRRIFPLVILTRGNHEYRLNKQIWSHLAPDVLWRVQNEADLLPKLANGIIYNEMAEEIDRLPFDNVYYEGGEEPWWTKWGKTIICHPYKGTSDYNAKTARNFMEKYFQFEDFDSIIVGHTHQVASIYVQGKKIIEQGCISMPFAYSKRGTEPYAPQQLGYALVYQDEKGNTLFDKTREVYLGVMTTHKSGNLGVRIQQQRRKIQKHYTRQLSTVKKVSRTSRKKPQRSRNKK